MPGGGPVTTSNFQSLLDPGVLTEVFGTKYNEFPLEYTAAFDTKPSRRKYEVYQEIGGVGLHVQKNEGVAMTLDTPGQGYQTIIQNISYGLGFQVTHEMIQDDQYDEIMSLTRDLAFSARQTQEIVAQNVLNNGTSGSYLGADGVPLFSTAHPYSISGGTGQNRPTSASSLSETSLNTDLVNIALFKDPAGKKIMVQAKTLIVPPALDFQSIKLLQSNYEAQTAQNAVNPLGRQYGLFPEGHKVFHFLTSASAYFIKTNQEGMVCQLREEVRFMPDQVVRQMVREFMSFYRKGFGWFDWRSMYSNPGA